MSQTGVTSEDTFDDDYHPSTQEIVAAQTQEASNASDFFDSLTASQIATSPTISPASSQSSDARPLKQELNNERIIDFDINGQPIVVEKKKRGRKRKIRTEAELIEHLKEKKEKNRLAAQRLRKKKCSEVAKYDQELNHLEANVKQKRRFADLIQTKVNKLRNKIEVMVSQTEPNESLDSSQQMAVNGINSLNISKKDAKICDNNSPSVKSETNHSGKQLHRLGLSHCTADYTRVRR